MSILQVTNFLYLFVLGLSTFFNRPTTLIGSVSSNRKPTPQNLESSLWGLSGCVNVTLKS